MSSQIKKEIGKHFTDVNSKPVNAIVEKMRCNGEADEEALRGAS
jgi:hypothetical protein